MQKFKKKIYPIITIIIFIYIFEKCYIQKAVGKIKPNRLKLFNSHLDEVSQCVATLNKAL